VRGRRNRAIHFQRDWRQTAMRHGSGFCERVYHGTPANGDCAGSDTLTFHVVDLVTHESASVSCQTLGVSCGSEAAPLGNQAY
jgi:hypothetical protein